ncbi:MFS transporter [Nocardioides sp. TF02-7]|uniref:MFS transporter n=1 Tax=Nocardioides sp. TF02-7 TaxID=2917724 RepID=UPI001F066B33|nr:MFS transporter [Nocardioides sp. TF02-7]UMG91458.1 MFS transporter [Nocardioides sp. TF02-7]
MTDLAATGGRAAPVPRGWVAGLVLVSIGVWSGFFGPIQVLLAQQAEEIAPADKESVLALVTGAGAAVSLVLNPLWGAFSDRTTLRAGRRLPWVVGGLVTGVLALLLLAAARSVVPMVLAWCLVQASLNAMLAAITAAVPDRVPEGERGTVGGWVAIAQTLGVIAGSGLAAATGSIAAGYAAVALLLLVLSLPYCLNPQDTAIASAPPFRLGAFVRSFWVSPTAHPDFAWAWATRFLVNLGNAVLLLYLLYYLTDEVGLGDDRAEDTVFGLTLVYGVCTVATAVAAGAWSDRAGRRQPFVVGSGLVMAVALVLLAAWPTLPVAWVGAVVLGIGFGAYTAVDFALITQVLPSADDRAKDLGVINIANALPRCSPRPSPRWCSAPSTSATRRSTSAARPSRCSAPSWSAGSARCADHAPHRRFGMLGEVSAEVWYVSYGSNMCRARLAAYLLGGRPAGARREYAGARNPSMPEDDVSVDLPGRLYFAGESPTWGGGVAFYDHDEPGPTAARAYRITAEQFADVAAQEMHRLPEPDDPIEKVVVEGLVAGRHEAGPGHYETLVEVGRRDGLPMLTFTAPHGHDAVEHTRPQPAYLAMLAQGLRESRGWDDDRIASYLEARTVAAEPARR